MSPSDDERRLYEITSAQRETRESMTLRWECRGVDCGERFTADATREEYEHGEASTGCPACGGLLSQEADPCSELEAILRRDERCVGEVHS